MQDGSERIKRRRLNGDVEDHLQAAAAGGGFDANANLQSLILRQRILAEQQQHQQPDAGLANSMALARASDQSLLAGAASGHGGDPMVAHLRQNLLSQQLHQAARLQAVSAADDLSYLRASEAAAGNSSLYASLLGQSNVNANQNAALANSLLLEERLRNESQSASSLSDQFSQRGRRGSAVMGPDQIRASYMQSLLEAEREEAAAAAAVAAESSGGMRHLLGLTAADNGNVTQASFLARLQNERAMTAAGMGMGAAGAFSPSALQSLISRGPVGNAGAAFNREMFLARGAGGPGSGMPPPPNSFLGMGMPGAAGMAGGMPGHGHPMQPKKRPAPATNPNTTGRQPIHLFMSCDMDDLSPYQCLVRKQIELFEAQDIDAETNARGRNRPIVVGQVGIRCKHCKMLPPRKRERAAIYYPSKLDRLYQAGQTMASVHLGQHCNHIPEHLRQELARLREGKSAALAGKKYWSDGARALGVTEDDERLFFKRE